MMDFSKIGWFILIYVGVGWILDVVSLLITIIILCYKEYKKKKRSAVVKQSNGDDIHLDTMDRAMDLIAYNYEYLKEKGIVLTIVISRLCWPVTIPLGLSRIIDNLKD